MLTGAFPQACATVTRALETRSSARNLDIGTRRVGYSSAGSRTTGQVSDRAGRRAAGHWMLSASLTVASFSMENTNVVVVPAAAGGARPTRTGRFACIAFPSNMGAWIPCRAVGMDVIVRQVFVSYASTVLSVPARSAHRRSPTPHRRAPPWRRRLATSVVGPTRSSIDPWRKSYTSFSGRAPTSSVSPR